MDDDFERRFLDAMERSRHHGRLDERDSIVSHLRRVELELTSSFSRLPWYAFLKRQSLVILIVAVRNVAALIAERHRVKDATPDPSAINCNDDWVTRIKHPKP